jgi:hypothetical protein
MSNVILIGGLPGSGKTHYLKALEVEGWEIFDDFQANADDNSPSFRMARRYVQLVQALRYGRRCAVSDMRFLVPGYRSEAENALLTEVDTVAIEWRFFENDPQQCALNIRRAAGARPPEPRLAKMREFSKKYSAPAEALRIPVWREK